MADVPKCPKCNTDMAEGALIYRTEGHPPEGATAAESELYGRQYLVEAEWVAKPDSGGRREAFSIRAFNCPRCNFVELYAP
jgi:Domain of unknown function (DUF6487)